MAEILVKAVDRTHQDPEVDRVGCYKRGMPVVVMEDGHQWGAQERLPKFIVLKLPGIEVSRVLQFIQPQLTGGAGSSVFRRRLWQLQWGDLPVGIRNNILATGSLVIGGPAGDVTWAQARNYIRRLDTNAAAPANI